MPGIYTNVCFLLGHIPREHCETWVRQIRKVDLGYGDEDAWRGGEFLLWELDRLERRIVVGSMHRKSAVSKGTADDIGCVGWESNPGSLRAVECMPAVLPRDEADRESYS